ncbi:MAG: SDR family oxidoreductase [Dethiobacter sp.]|jgi:NAD(P)-dependent dehydrogenase (short-subunit alcohol dehydrogenase family)|nr:SDR family oxidoreductase [Dethiobacter sp.]
MSEIRFDGRVAVVTGAGGGLGKAYALLLASRGAKVVVNDLGGSVDGLGADAAPAQKVADEIMALGGEAVANYNSVSEWESAQKIIQSAIDNYGKIDILINNAGILRDKSILKMELDDYLKIMAVHLNGTFFCTKAAFAHMRQQNYGRIVSTSSTAGVYGNFGQTNYGTAKMGIAGLMNSVKQEGARCGILANTIIPTAGTRITATVMPQDIVEKIKPEYVAPIVAWLCSEQCNVSGKMFTAGGGYFSRAAVVEGPGVFFDPERELTVEMVVEKLEQISSVKDGREFDSAMEQSFHIISKMGQTQ